MRRKAAVPETTGAVVATAEAVTVVASAVSNLVMA